MPELPEVEQFRQILLPLIGVSTDCNERPLTLERSTLDRQPPRLFLTDDEINTINNSRYHVSEILRRGKQILMVLTNTSHDNDNKEPKKTLYLAVHMGMTGRISSRNIVPTLESQTSTDYPPAHTYLKFQTDTYEACFSDPRKFGAIFLEPNRHDSRFASLAPDALNELHTTTFSKTKDDTKKEQPNQKQVRPEIVEKIANKSMGIKALLLDQKRAVSGVGNWVVDEVLYQEEMHPEQSYLTLEQAESLLKRLHSILQTAVQCLSIQEEYGVKGYPETWLFHFRWNKRKTTKDYYGRTVTFITAGGRTTALVPSIQKKKGTKKRKTSNEGKTKQKEEKMSKSVRKRKTVIDKGNHEETDGKEEKMETKKLRPARSTNATTKSKRVAPTRTNKSVAGTARPNKATTTKITKTTKKKTPRKETRMNGASTRSSRSSRGSSS